VVSDKLVCEWRAAPKFTLVPVTKERTGFRTTAQ